MAKDPKHRKVHDPKKHGVDGYDLEALKASARRKISEKKRDKNAASRNKSR